MSLATQDRRRAERSCRGPLPQNDVFKGKSSPESRPSTEAVLPPFCQRRKGPSLVWTDSGSSLPPTELRGNALPALVFRG